MDLSIDYTCPRCQRVIKQRLQDLAPGQGRFCAACHEHAVLTGDGLKLFSEQLARFCTPSHA